MKNMTTKKEIMEEAEWMLEHLSIGYSPIFEVVDWRATDTPLASFDYLPKFKKYIKGLRDRKIRTWRWDYYIGHLQAFVVVVD